MQSNHREGTKMKFKLQAIEELYSGTGTAPASHTTEFEAEALPEIVMNIELFLRGAGFYIKNLDYEVPDS